MNRPVRILAVLAAAFAVSSIVAAPVRAQQAPQQASKPPASPQAPKPSTPATPPAAPSSAPAAGTSQGQSAAKPGTPAAGTTAQTKPAPKPPAKAAAAAPCTTALSLTDVVRLIAERTAQRRLIARIESCGIDFGLTSEREGVLKAAMAPEPVLAAVRKASDLFVAQRDAESQRQQEEEAVRMKEAEATAWGTAKASLDPADLEKFLKEYPESTHESDARARLADLRPASRQIVTDAHGVTWAEIPAGAYEMGCTAGDTDCYADERPAHHVILPKPFWMMTTELSVGQYRATGFVLPSQPDWSAADRYPVVNVAWDQAARTCRAMGGRLPTEAEWEYAARGGVSVYAWVWGKDKAPLIDGRQAGNVADATAAAKAGGSPLFSDYDDGFADAAPVGLFAANSYGLFDMAGNVWEWVSDWYDAAIYKKNAKPSPTGPATGKDRVVRGGSWGNPPRSLRVSTRAWGTATILNSVGFRCVRDTAPTP
jgi:formylglycine-generating enzyme